MFFCFAEIIEVYLKYDIFAQNYIYTYDGGAVDNEDKYKIKFKISKKKHFRLLRSRFVSNERRTVPVQHPRCASLRFYDFSFSNYK
jgi:hypothetical protein